MTRRRSWPGIKKTLRTEGQGGGDEQVIFAGDKGHEHRCQKYQQPLQGKGVDQAVEPDLGQKEEGRQQDQSGQGQDHLLGQG